MAVFVKDSQDYTRSQELQRDMPMQLEVIGYVHYTHASAAELRENATVRNSLVRVYTRLSPVVPSEHNTFSRTVPPVASRPRLPELLVGGAGNHWLVFACRKWPLGCRCV